MIEYNIKVKNAKGNIVQIYQGEVTDMGYINFDLPEENIGGGVISIDWKRDGNDRNK